MTKSKVRESGRYQSQQCCKEKHSLECSKSAWLTALCNVHDPQCNFADVGTGRGSLASSRGYLEIAGNGQLPTQPTTRNHHAHHASPMCSKYTDQSLLSFCSVSIILLREYPRISRLLCNPRNPVADKIPSLPLFFSSRSDTIQYRTRNEYETEWESRARTINLESANI